MNRPSIYTGYAIDLDGTVYLGDELLPGAAETIAELRRAGSTIVFVTNKPLETAEQYAAKLSRLGVAAKASDVVTAVDALVHYLGDRYHGRPLLLISEQVVADRLAAEGFLITEDPSAADVVVVAFDRTFSYAKLHAGYRAVRENQARIVATNPDPWCPTPDGGLPDCAAMLAALEACTGATAEAIVGKPSRFMAEAILNRLDLPAAEIAIVGDRPGTDVAMSQQIGAVGILVLTGATTAEAASSGEVKPDFVLESLAGLLPTTGMGIR